MLDGKLGTKAVAMRSQRIALVGAFCGSVLAGWIAAALCEFSPSGTKDNQASFESIQTAATLEGIDAPRAGGIGHDDAALDTKVVGAAVVEVGLPTPVLTLPAIASSITPDPLQSVADETAIKIANAEIVSAASEPAPTSALPPIASAGIADRVRSADDETADEFANTQSASPPLSNHPPAATRGVQLATLLTSARVEEDVKPIVRPVEKPNECLVAEICIDDYLWSLYEVTPKIDTNKVTERIKVAVTKMGRTRTITKITTKYVVGDFTWKDPIAAQRGGISLKDYVIGGMDRGFKLKLYHALREMDAAGLMPGITSAFRDDYRQSIASGNKAASDSSYHGGSRRGGYGHGLAADLVSLQGDTRLQRYASSKELWKWIDAHETELGIGRPYLDRDPPHVAPIDGKEYADKRGAKAIIAGSTTRSYRPATAGENQTILKPAAAKKSLRVGSI